MQLETINIEDVKVYESNPRNNKAAVGPVAESIRSFGFKVPVIVDCNNVLIAGHTRVRAAEQLGLTEIPAVRADDLTPEQVRSFRIADNKLHELSSWDLDLLKLELSDLQSLDVDLADLGFTVDELTKILDGEVKDGLTDPDAVPEPADEPTTKHGDLWVLGDHRLLCGDCTDSTSVAALMDGDRAALFQTDPPYLVSYAGNNHPHKWNEKPKNKDWTDSYAVTWDDADANPDLYDQFVATAIENAIRTDAAWYCWHASRRQAMLEEVWTKHGAFVHQQIIWAKDRPILTRSWYMWQHEPCFFGWLKSHRPPRMASDYPPSVWTIPTIPPGTKTDHPTSKPVELFAIPMRQHTKQDDICYEPFSGSGSQIIAAEQLSRRCFAMEISPTYVDVAVERWEQFTGRKAERVENLVASADASGEEA